MVTLQNHVSSILDKSARTAADELIKLFDSSYEAFSEELRKRQEEIDSLRRRLEVAETERVRGSVQAFLCVQCGLSLNCVVPLQGNQGDQDLGLKSSFSNQAMALAPIEERDAVQVIEIGVLSKEDSSYVDLIQVDKKTGPSRIEHQEKPPHKEESNPQKIRRDSPTKKELEPVFVPQKKGRGSPRKTTEEVILKSPSTLPALSIQTQPKEAEIQKESAIIPQPVQLSPTQTSNKDPEPEFTIHLLDPLLLPFAMTMPILPAHENHKLEPETLTNELQDKFPSIEVPKAEKPEPGIMNQVYRHDKTKRKGITWLQCPKCPRQFPSNKKLQGHMKVHLKKGETKCNLCGLTFIGNSQMINHMRVHTGEKPYSCDFCSRRFPNVSQYKKHLLKHAAPEYTCEVCGLRASQVCTDTFRKAHLRSKEPCSNCSSFYT